MNSEVSVLLLWCALDEFLGDLMNILLDNYQKKGLNATNDASSVLWRKCESVFEMTEN